MIDKDHITKIVEARDGVDEKFLQFATRRDGYSGNYEALANLALIGGRLDTLLRRALEQRRKQQRKDRI